jgi:hypothetical protein
MIFKIGLVEMITKMWNLRQSAGMKSRKRQAAVQLDRERPGLQCLHPVARHETWPEIFHR